MTAAETPYATVQKDGYPVPLIGIPEAVLEECGCCHELLPLSKVQFNGVQMLCEKCAKQNQTA